MKQYEKPEFILTDDIAEGVFATGESTAVEEPPKPQQEITMSRYQIDFDGENNGEYGNANDTGMTYNAFTYRLELKNSDGSVVNGSINTGFKDLMEDSGQEIWFRDAEGNMSVVGTGSARDGVINFVIDNPTDGEYFLYGHGRNTDNIGEAEKSDSLHEETHINGERLADENNPYDRDALTQNDVAVQEYLKSLENGNGEGGDDDDDDDHNYNPTEGDNDGGHGDDNGGDNEGDYNGDNEGGDEGGGAEGDGEGDGIKDFDDDGETVD